MRGLLGAEVIGNPLLHCGKLHGRDFFVRKILKAAFAFVATLFPASCPHVPTGKLKIDPGETMATCHPLTAG
jgi:hypothetical protein